MKLIHTQIKNNVLETMMHLLNHKRAEIIAENKKDLAAFDQDDKALYDRLVVDSKKVDEMIKAIKDVQAQEDPVDKDISNITLDSGLNIINKTAPFGTIMIIYESRPDVTIEAAVLAFKANNKILLKGGKEAYYSNCILEQCWHEALEANELSKDWIRLLHLNRTETQAFLKNPPEKLDLIVPRGGERLIQFVKEHATCAVLISGRGNNFLYVHKDADWEKALKVILNAKTHKISGCNALDKVLIHKDIDQFPKKLKVLKTLLDEHQVAILTDEATSKILADVPTIPSEAIWYEEFLAMKIVLASTSGLDEAVEKINRYSGGHSAAIITENKNTAFTFMQQVDNAAVYHNASTRFTDGGQMGIGAELAISTDKLHHRGPLGLKQLVTNKYYVFGDGHIRA